MKEYAPDESVSLLEERISQCGLPEQDRELLIEFKDWLIEQTSAEETACILYVWYDLCSSIEFSLEQAGEHEIRSLLAHAPEHSKELYNEAVTLFYDRFLAERSGSEDS